MGPSWALLELSWIVLEACWEILAALVALLGRLGSLGESQDGAIAAQRPPGVEEVRQRGHSKQRRAKLVRLIVTSHSKLKQTAGSLQSADAFAVHVSQ